MPLGIGFMGNVEGRKEFMQRQESQMPLGIGFMGNTAFFVVWALNLSVSQMPLGIGFMGNTSASKPTRQNSRPASQMPLGIGFMGNQNPAFLGFCSHYPVTNASRHWVHGELASPHGFAG